MSVAVPGVTPRSPGGRSLSSMSLASRIISTGSYVPDRIVSNEDIAPLLGVDASWIEERSGIQERRWVDGTTSTSELAYEASIRALKRAELSADEIDMVILATISPDHDFPGTACFLQEKLDIPAGIPALDIRQQCTGFIYGLSVADAFIRTGQARRVLLVGSEIHSKGIDVSPRGKDVSMLFGDGAGAMILEAIENPGPEGSQLFSTHIHADGRHAKLLWAEAPGQALPEHRITKEVIDEGRHFAQMSGSRVFMHAVRRMPESVEEALAANDRSIAEVDRFFFHQANLRINEAVAKRMDLAPDKVFNTIQRFGNTTAATIPLGIDTAFCEGDLVPGMLVVLSAFGSGFTWGSALLRF